MVNRVLRDDPTKSDMHNRQGLTLKKLIQALSDWKLWPLYILGLTHQGELSREKQSIWALTVAHGNAVPVTPPQTYLTLSLRKLGFNTTQANLLSIPSTVLGAINLLILSYLSEVFNSRTGTAILLQVWALPLLIALETFTRRT